MYLLTYAFDPEMGWLKINPMEEKLKFWVDLPKKEQQAVLAKAKALVWKDEGREIGPLFISPNTLVKGAMEGPMPYEKSRFNPKIARWFTLAQARAISKELNLQLRTV